VIVEFGMSLTLERLHLLGCSAIIHFARHFEAPESSGKTVCFWQRSNSVKMEKTFAGQGAY
jgi:hypothetical protein